MSVVVIRLHPEEPTDGITFRSYLEGLEIEVAERSFADPAGTVNVLGTARYIAEGDPNATIIQHWEFFPPIRRMPAATAAVDLATPLGFDEYGTVDVVLKVTRTVPPNPTRTILYKHVNFNVDLAAGSLPPRTPAAFAALGPVALYVALPESLIGLSPGTAYVDIPQDGTPPSYDALVAAINAVLSGDPGAPAPDLASLTPKQAEHIAYEIVHNRSLEPLPEPARPLEQLYEDDTYKTEREQFEADLVTYYTLRDTQAAVLAKYIYSVAAANACTDLSESATRVGFTFPVRPGLTESTEKIREATVVVSQ